MRDGGGLNTRRPGGDRWAWAALGVAAAVASVVILRAGEGFTFGADELHYFGRLVGTDGAPVAYGLGPEYLLAPHNGHLQVGGKLVYEASFGLFGTAHAPLRVAELLGVLACVGLFFELARRRIGSAPALVAAVSLLFMGAAWEVMLWAFDLHTTYALAFGLAAVLALERGDRRGDLAACTLLIASVAMIEVGLAFLAAAAILIAAGREPVRRAWVVAAPAALYAAWWLWARRFDHDDLELSRIADLPSSVAESMTAVTAAFTGLYAHGGGVFPNTLDPEPAAVLLAGLATLALALGLWRARVTHRALAMIAALAVYWALIALAARPPDSSRYMWFGAIVLALIAAEVLAGWAARSRHGALLAAAIAIVFVLSLPVGLDKLSDGREWSLSVTEASRVEFAMLDLAGERADPDFDPGARPFAGAGLPSGPYLRAADRIGPLGLSLDELRTLPPSLRARADQVLGLAYGLSARAARHAELGGCRRIGSGSLRLPPGGAGFRGSRDRGALALARFSDTGVVKVGRPDRDEPVVVEIPRDSAGDPWRAFAPPGTRVCELLR